MMKNVKITAIRKVQHADLMAEYENPIEHTCDVCEGQSWISIGGECPEGLCPEAWKTMREFVAALARGEGNFYDGWMKNPYSAMISCNDGFRPVSFYIETIEEMRGERITLRPWRDSDARSLYKYASNLEVGPRAGWAPHQSEAESLKIIQTVFNNPTTWAIVCNKTGEAIGAMGYGPSCDCCLPARGGEPTVGYWVGRPYWGMGICTEALALMIEHIRTATNIKSLISGHFTDNPASGRVMEKCGFTPTGETASDENLYMGSQKQIRVLRLEL